MLRLGLSLVLLVTAIGCAGSEPESAESAAGAATASDPATPSEPASIAGYFTGHMRGWDGSLQIEKTDAGYAFELEASADAAISRPGYIRGVAVAKGDHYAYTDGFCSLDIEPLADGDVFINADRGCGLALDLDVEDGPVDITSTWRRYNAAKK
jgi:hypothetical protein